MLKLDEFEHNFQLYTIFSIDQSVLAKKEILPAFFEAEMIILYDLEL